MEKLIKYTIKKDRIPTKKQAQDIIEIKQYDWNKRNINWKNVKEKLKPMKKVEHDESSDEK